MRSRTRARGRSASNYCGWTTAPGVVVVVTDPCPLPPVKSDLTEDAEHGRGLHVVDALSARWGWAPQDSGKAVFAIVTREG